MLTSQPIVIVLIGATASGKTELAVEIAKYFKTSIHNIDSRQVYKLMDVGTAKPSKKQQNEVKHHLIDLKEPKNLINVKSFQEIAQTSIKREIKQNKLPFLVGGSGLYMNSIIKGFFMPDIPPQVALRAQLEKLGQKKCWDILKSCDPTSTKQINYADQIRTIRALEVFYVTGKPISSLKVQNPPSWRILELGIEREDIKERILQRTKNMFSTGIIEETQNIIAKYGSGLPILETIGYKESKEVLIKKLTIDQAIESTSKKTIQFAKRQRTWFRNKNNPVWLNNKNLLKDAIIKVESFLG